jgi:hypothetical protein
MLAFRPSLLADRRSLTPEFVTTTITELIGPAHFFVRAPLRLTWQYRPDEEVYWELFLGRALDARQTRRRQRFETWGAYVVDADRNLSDEPLMAVRYDATAGDVFVTRAILSHAHESYDAGGNVIETRETVRWQRELVGRIRRESLATCGEFADELACLLFQAVVGTSRLPLTSIEAPLPAFMLGQLGYLYRPAAAGPLREVDDLLPLVGDRSLADIERVKLTELFLRAANDAALTASIPGLVEDDSGDPFARLRQVFNGVALSPYTDFAAKALAVPRLARAAGLASAGQVADFLTWLLRHLARHLTAYDLVTFHHRGANYPDALLIDEVLRELRPLADEMPELFAENERFRRRGLRLGLLLVEEYRDHPVPDAPTSPGENARVLPEPFVRVPDEQIFAPMMRRRRLFAQDVPGDRDRLRELLGGLEDSDELIELGTALFLDRPLGAWKQPGEADQTLLVAHLLVSRSIALRRVGWLTRRPELLPDPTAAQRWKARLETRPVEGVPLERGGPPPRPGVVSLQDAFVAADDWLMVRTTRRTVDDLFRQYQLEGAPPPQRLRLVVPEQTGDMCVLRLYDEALSPICDLKLDHSRGYRARGGEEVLAGGIVPTGISPAAR